MVEISGCIYGDIPIIKMVEISSWIYGDIPIVKMAEISGNVRFLFSKLLIEKFEVLTLDYDMR